MGKKARYELHRGELDTIFDWLEPQITLRDKRWLNEEWPGLWKGKSIEKAINEIRKRNKVRLCIGIEAILDAKERKKATYYRPVTTLGVKDLSKIAGMLGIEIPEGIKVPELRDLIIEQIEAGRQAH